MKYLEAGSLNMFTLGMVPAICLWRSDQRLIQSGNLVEAMSTASSKTNLAWSCIVGSACLQDRRQDEVT